MKLEKIRYFQLLPLSGRDLLVPYRDEYINGPHKMRSKVPTSFVYVYIHICISG